MFTYFLSKAHDISTYPRSYQFMCAFSFHEPFYIWNKIDFLFYFIYLNIYVAEYIFFGHDIFADEL